MKKTELIIDFAKTFPHLNNAPIVEAAIEIRFVIQGEWEEAILRGELQRRLPDYPKIESLKVSRFQVPSSRVDHLVVEELGCIGFKLSSNDNRHVAQFNKEQFVVSRLKPYGDWNQFITEASRLLKIYEELLQPTEVQRIGLRFINRFGAEQTMPKLSDYYKSVPNPFQELDLPLIGFLHHDVIQIPKTPYSVNLIKTIQPIQGGAGLILDIDVFMPDKFEYNEQKIMKYLHEMRWVKNKIFFSSVTESAIREFE